MEDWKPNRVSCRCVPASRAVYLQPADPPTIALHPAASSASSASTIAFGERLDTMSSGDNQQPQALAKPTFTEVQASALVESVFGFKVSKIQPLPSYDDQNFRVHISRLKDSTDDPSEYVLKISNTESSKTPDLIEMQNHIIMFLRAAGFPTAFVCRTKGDNTTFLVSIDSGSEIKSYLVRMLTYLPGRPIAEISISHQLLYEIGRLAAKLDKTLEGLIKPRLPQTYCPAEDVLELLVEDQKFTSRVLEL